MMVPEKARISEKYLFSKTAAVEMMTNRLATIAIASKGATRLFILSVNGSALPMPPHEPHRSPCWFFLRQKGSSFFLAQASHEQLSLPLVQVPVPEQCWQSYRFTLISCIKFIPLNILLSALLLSCNPPCKLGVWPLFDSDSYRREF